MTLFAPEEAVEAELALVALGAAFRRHHFTACAHEKEVQDAIATIFNVERMPFVRECVLSPTCRPDFFLPSGVAVEVKVDGSASEVFRQLQRYAQHPDVRGVFLVTTRSRHLVPLTVGGKPARPHLLSRGDL